MDKQLSLVMNKLDKFKIRMSNASLNLNAIKNNFPQTRSVFNKEQIDGITDGDSINELIIDYLSFFNENKIILENMANKKQSQMNEIANILAEMYSIYNELINYADLILLGKYQESIEKQNAFINNVANINLLNRLPEPKANELNNNNKIYCLITILLYQKHVNNDNEQYQKLFETFYYSLYENYKRGKLTNQQYQYLLFIEAFYYYIIGKQQLSYLSLGLLFHEFIDHQDIKSISHNKLLQIKSKISLQYIGLGDKPYITMTLPQDFKKFVHYSLSNIQQTKNEILYEKKRISSNQ